MPLTRPRLRADEVQAGDRLLVVDDLDLDKPLPAMPMIENVATTGEFVVLRVAGRGVRLPADAEVVVEREISAI